jgi:hypothetical protein
MKLCNNKKVDESTGYFSDNPGRSLRTPYTAAYGRLRRRIRPYTCYLRSVYDRILPYYMIQYYGRISPWPYTEKYGDRIRSVYARKRPSFSVYGRKRASLENYGTLTMVLSRFMPFSPEIQPTYRPVRLLPSLIPITIGLIPKNKLI